MSEVASSGSARPVDLQAHRGGMGIAPENSLEAFGNALTLGVSTLELDVHVSADGIAIVHHDRMLPSGELITTLTATELELRVGASGQRMPHLAEVLALVQQRQAHDVRLNIETKFDVIHPDEGAPRERFVEVTIDTLRAADLAARTSIQSFDWAVLALVGDQAPECGRNALVSRARLEIDAEGASPWLDGVDVDDFADSFVQAVASLGLDAVSPDDPMLTAAVIDEARDAQLGVIPYTVDDPARMRELIEWGVDGIITNRPDLARGVWAELGLALPPSYPPPS